MALAPGTRGYTKAIVAAVKAANDKQRRITSICRFNMDILMIVD